MLQPFLLLLLAGILLEGVAALCVGIQVGKCSGCSERAGGACHMVTREGRVGLYDCSHSS
jgi:hypothetical protein